MAVSSDELDTGAKRRCLTFLKPPAHGKGDEMGVKYSLSAFILLGALFLASAGWAADLSVRVHNLRGGVVQKKVMSMKELKFKNIVRQKTDFSCGAAALATIMKYLYNDHKVSEEKIVEWLLKNGDLEKIQQRGFSLLDLKVYAQKAGYKAGGYRVKPEQLTGIKIPTIVLLDTNGYSHFVVLKGVLGDKTYIADPALGNRKMRMGEFLAAWNGLVLGVYGKELESAYGRFDGPLSLDKSEVWGLSDQMMRNLFMNTYEFRK